MESPNYTSPVIMLRGTVGTYRYSMVYTRIIRLREEITFRPDGFTLSGQILSFRFVQASQPAIYRRRTESCLSNEIHLCIPNNVQENTNL